MTTDRTEPQPTGQEPAHQEPPVALGTADDPGATAGHDEHGHTEEPLGPIDLQAWGAGALGIGVGLVMTLCFVLGTAAAAG